jgi:D-alanyl-D-alanine carboxypeptidase
MDLNAVFGAVKRAVTRKDPPRLGFGVLCRIAAIIAFALIPWASEAQARNASIVIHYDTGKVLHAVNPDTRIYPASLTKMMTLYLAFEALQRGDLSPDHKLKVSRHAAGMPPSKLGLKAGETIMAKDVILALITKSANDAAVVMAEALGGSEIQFARLMTQKAHSLGMYRTSFQNASGLPNILQRSTARDMATLARALIRDFPGYYRLFATNAFTFRGRTYPNHNRLVRTYRGADGIKTGYIRASGYNVATSAVRRGSRLIAVVLGGKSPRSRDGRAARILDRAFAGIGSSDVRKLPSPPPRKPISTLAVSAMDAVEAAAQGSR